jgi:hypothetical protein
LWKAVDLKGRISVLIRDAFMVWLLGVVEWFAAME